jgi:hypothetical protein
VEAPVTGWGDPQTIVLLAGSAALLGAFVLIESRHRAPLVPARHPPFTDDRGRPRSRSAAATSATSSSGSSSAPASASPSSPPRSPPSPASPSTSRGSPPVSATRASRSAQPSRSPSSRPSPSRAPTTPGRQRRRQSARGAHRGLPVGLSSCCRPRRYRRRALAPAPRARAGRWRWTASSRSSGARRLCSRVQRCSGSAARHSRRPAWRPLIRQRLLSRRNASTKPHERRDRLPEERSLVDARGDAASRVQSKPGPYFVSRRAFLREPCERRFSPLLREHVVERGAKAERLEG